MAMMLLQCMNFENAQQGSSGCCFQKPIKIPVFNLNYNDFMSKQLPGYRP